MDNQIIYAVVLCFGFYFLIGMSEILHHNFRINSDVTRKIAHLSAGMTSLLFPILFDSHWYVFILCIQFVAILFLSFKYEFIQSINSVKRRTNGSFIYPIAIYLVFLISEKFGSNLSVYYIPVLILTISDTLASIFGKYFPFGKYKIFGGIKTMTGSIVFFISSFIICFLSLYIMDTENPGLYDLISISSLIGLITAGLEAIAHHGLDNLTIPAGAILMLSVFNYLQ
jgi:dolichol kinase